MKLSIDQIVRIAAAGGGLTIDASDNSVDQVVRIAAAASTHQASLVIRHTQTTRSYCCCQQRLCCV